VAALFTMTHNPEMNGQKIRRAIDSAIKPLGFAHSKSIWTRTVNDLVDVISMQSSNLDSTFTLNVGVFNRELRDILWDGRVKQIDEPVCVIGIRAGMLKFNNKKDHWWPLHDPATPDEIVACVKEYVLPFFDRHHSFEAMIEFLENRKVQKYTSFPAAYFLALLYFRTNRQNDGCLLLRQLEGNARKICTRYGKSYDSETELETRLLRRYGCMVN
jgi:hypothetical protein